MTPPVATETTGVAAEVLSADDRRFEAMRKGDWAALMRAEARARLGWLLPPGTILCMPTTPFPAPPKGLSLTALEPVRLRILCLAAHGGLAGFPEASLPGAHVEGVPVGLSVLGARGSDAALVAVAQATEAAR